MKAFKTNFEITMMNDMVEALKACVARRVLDYKESGKNTKGMEKFSELTLRAISALLKTGTLAVTDIQATDFRPEVYVHFLGKYLKFKK